MSVCVLLDQKLYPESMMLYSLITPRQCIMSIPIGLSGVKVKVQVKILINTKLCMLSISYMCTDAIMNPVHFSLICFVDCCQC